MEIDLSTSFGIVYICWVNFCCMSFGFCCIFGI